MAIDRDHPIVGAAVVYTDWSGTTREQGTVTSVNEADGLIFARFGSGSTSAACRVDDRLRMLDGRLVSDALLARQSTRQDAVP